MEVHKKTTLGNLIIKEVPKILAKELIIEHHYSHKWNDGGFGKFNYGIFRAEEPERCLGVAVYGFMKNPSAKIFTHPNPEGEYSQCIGLYSWHPPNGYPLLGAFSIVLD